MTKQWNFDLFIDGKWDKGEAGGKQIEVLNPATEEVVGIVPEASAKDAAARDRGRAPCVRRGPLAVDEARRARAGTSARWARSCSRRAPSSAR